MCHGWFNDGRLQYFVVDAKTMHLQVGHESLLDASSRAIPSTGKELDF